MPTVIETTVYQFDELSDNAKAKARDWFREASAGDNFQFEPVVEDFCMIADRLGLSLDTHEVRLVGGNTRPEPSVWYSLGYVQGDFAAFDGSYRYRTGAAKAVKGYAPQDRKLHAIADKLQEVQKRNMYGLTAVIKNHHYYGLTVEVEHNSGREVSEEDHTTVKEAFRSLAAWLYDEIRSANDDAMSDESVDDAIIANEYTFTAEGKRFG